DEWSGSSPPSADDIVQRVLDHKRTTGRGGGPVVMRLPAENCGVYIASSIVSLLLGSLLDCRILPPIYRCILRSSAASYDFPIFEITARTKAPSGFPSLVRISVGHVEEGKDCD
ncbi:hypothetical protein PENTCL1PPCAC_7369, partial [Pristionchus entomophagus]